MPGPVKEYTDALRELDDYTRGERWAREQFESYRKEAVNDVYPHLDLTHSEAVQWAKMRVMEDHDVNEEGRQSAAESTRTPETDYAEYRAARDRLAELEGPDKVRYVEALAAKEGDVSLPAWTAYLEEESAWAEEELADQAEGREIAADYDL